MRNIRSLFDKSDERSSGEEDETDAFTGGHRSGLAVRYPGQKSKNNVVIFSFHNGFIIDDGPFRPLSDPHNVAFMDAIRNGNVPEELRTFADPSSGELNVELKQFEADYDPANPPPTMSRKQAASNPPEQPSVPRFSGNAQTLGGGNTAISADSVTGDNFPAPIVPPESASISIQFRLPTGLRITRSFDGSSVGSSVRSYIASGLGVESSAVRLSSGFPPKPLSVDDLERSILTELGLSGASIQVTLVVPRS